MNDNLGILFNAICDLTGSLEQMKPAQRTSSDYGLELRALMNRAKSEILLLLASQPMPLLFVKVGYGNGFISRVPWIFISRQSGPVSSKFGVTIAFGRCGNGVVAGAMYPNGVVRNQTFRSFNKNKENFIDVDGDSMVSRYNDRFVCPIEVKAHSCQMNKVDEVILDVIRCLTDQKS